MPMRLFGVAMVRDEADVIETFVRHNLNFLDGLAIIEHCSVDGTAEILTKLASEGLPVRIVSNRDPAQFQSRLMTELSQETLQREDADFIFALDADEFLKIPSRAQLERALAVVPPGLNALAHWLTYVPDDFEASDAVFGPGHLWWRLKHERHAVHKIIASRALLSQPGAYITEGNHLVSIRGAEKPPAHARLPSDLVAFAHCPVRSRKQIEGKVIVGFLADLAARGPGKEFAHHWGHLYKELRAGEVFTPERLREIACNYTLPRHKWRPVGELELVEDPVPLAVDLRYAAEGRPDTLRKLMHFAESLIVQQESRARAGTIDII